MKILALLFFFGIASASFYDALDTAADEAVQEFFLGMEEAPSLKLVLGIADSEAVDEVEADIKTELAKHLRERLDKPLDKIKKAVEHGRTVREELLDKLREIREKMKEVKEDMGEKAKEMLTKLKEKAREIFKKLLDQLGINKRSANDAEVALTELSIRDMLRKLKEHLLEKVDSEYLKEKILKIFGQGTELVEQLLKTLREKGKEKLRILIDHLLGDDDDDVDKRSLSELWEKVKDYFKDLNIDLKEKFAKFGEWVKDVFDKGLEKSKDKFENIRALGKEFLKHAKGISKEIGTEALDFFRQYKDQLGDLWDEIRESVKDARDKNKDNM